MRFYVDAMCKRNLGIISREYAPDEDWRLTPATEYSICAALNNTEEFRRNLPDTVLALRPLFSVTLVVRAPWNDDNATARLATGRRVSVDGPIFRVHGF